MKQRIWELDALRGLCILGMVAVHLTVDLVDLFGILRWRYPEGFWLLKQWGGTVFFLLSGCCAGFSRSSVKRGLVVLLFGFAVSVVMAVPCAMGLFPREMRIYFGALHCLGTCMLLWSAMKKLPGWLLWVLCALSVALGLYFLTLPGVDTYWLMPLGLCWKGFSSPDFFPLFPYLGFFLLGALLGRRLYPDKRSLFPNGPRNHPLLKFLQFCGRHSLPIYLLHQPILMGLCLLLTLI